MPIFSAHALAIIAAIFCCATWLSGSSTLLAVVLGVAAIVAWTVGFVCERIEKNRSVVLDDILDR